ncbi:inositol hexakisphosphate and diphosphoinositol-pentakisphosphate kinase 2-like isoform X6 [Biomphalaria glabrata]|uniref:Inositol hexakisphosphate and diphosphoinositol-pentakisphosphate kinase n=1 Tax=Biomphalaria glabrata TaxID=6526 RepID=A0A9W2YG67_BIOGL|nr:inositol hexakisphosphate and diphosphoinositol-pentakisphosphate kinase 2-like isoform X6 [Biomphalaria glabrata]
MASGSSHPDKSSKKTPKKSSFFSFGSKKESDKKPWFAFPGFLPKMPGHGRFQVSASDFTTHPKAKCLSIPIQQRLLEFEDEDNDRKVILGICAMAKKSHSKPMNEIIRRLVDNFERLEVIVFDEDTILNKPVEDWPVVNGFVSFFSHGFPLEKAIAYKDLRNPFIVNDLEMQYILQSRPKVYALMKENNIPHPRYAVLDRENDPDCHIVETEDSIEVNGDLFMKPFVEKPIDAEDHNIYIYFPVQAGGGSTRLFRKVKDRSSVYSRFCRVRNKGSFLYEDFMPTDGTDVKVYTVGPDYQHAEARKSPALDGKVERDQDGKEIRYPVLLSNCEKIIARNVCKVFKQNVCGFDLLRANGKYYVCDVNGFSFVKTSSKYYDDCAKILGTLVMRACCPQLHIPYPLCTAPEDIPVVQTTSGSMMELRCVIAVIRHGDRTPKQKMKMEVKNKKFFDLFEKYGGYKTGHLKLKKPKQLQEVLDIVRDLLAEGHCNTDPEVAEKKAKLNQLKLVLEMYGHFSGINRKVQLKYQPTGRPKKSSSEEGSVLADHETLDLADDSPRDPSLVLILKWGGELTPAGRVQAENLGKAFRTLYPGGQGGQFEAPGLGFLRLHSTFRHDLKIYASDEGRVQMTAAAFTKGLLALEGELTPIVVQMVKSANTNGLLDGESNTSKYQIVVKEKLKDIFNQDREFTVEDYQKLAATNSISLVNAMQFVKNPFQMCVRVHDMIKEITSRIRCLKMELKSRDLTLFNGESWELLIRRWAKLEKDFRLKNNRFDISKIPDIYDCIKYDLQHNQKTLQFKRAQELFMCSKALADIIIPQEYGITKEERLHIGQNYCTPLLRKIRCDLLQCINEQTTDESTTRLDSKQIQFILHESNDIDILNRYSNGVASPERFVRTRLYFTSESHIHSLLNMLRYGDFLDEEKDEQWKRSMDFIGACAELNYMSQIVLMMFEDPAQDEGSDDRFHIELHFSPGAYTSCDEMTSEPKGMGFRPKPNREVYSEATTPVIIPENQEEVAEAAVQDVLELPTPLRQCASVPDNIKQEELGDLVEADLFAQVQETVIKKESQSDTIVCSKQKTKFKFHPHSPDPNTPEWDWGDDDETPEEENKRSREVTKHKKHIHAKEELHKQKSLPPAVDSQLQTSVRSPDEEKRSFSLPRSVEMRLRKQDSKFDKESSDILEEEKDSLSKLAFKKTDPIQINVSLAGAECKSSSEEKRSRSLEDSSDIVTKLRDQDIDGMSSQSRRRVSKNLGEHLSAAYQRNYRTIHLPLGSDVVVKPLSHFFFYNQAPRDLMIFSQTEILISLHQRGPLPLGGLSLIGSASSPDFSRLHGEMALEGFNNVPLLHPLETLHNNLTFHQMDDFLGRVTTNRFSIPDVTIALASLNSKSVFNLCSPSRVSEIPSSSNSSGGPNSPTVQTTPVDLFKTLGMFMGTRSISQSESESGADGKPEDIKDANCSQTAAEDGLLEITSTMSGSYCITMNKTEDIFQTQNSLEELCIEDSSVK